jgi:type IV pilus assembly protein PilK
VDCLIDEVTVQETTFLRDRYQLNAIGWHSLLQAARAAGSGTIRVWSVGCASGEEAYTLALMAAEAFAPAPGPVDVLGTDISGAALAAAAAGRYRERAVRALEPPLRSRYLDLQADGSTWSATASAAGCASGGTTSRVTRNRPAVRPAST